MSRKDLLSHQSPRIHLNKDDLEQEDDRRQNDNEHRHEQAQAVPACSLSPSAGGYTTSTVTVDEVALASTEPAGAAREEGKNTASSFFPEEEAPGASLSFFVFCPEEITPIKYNRVMKDMEKEEMKYIFLNGAITSTYFNLEKPL